MLAAAPFLSLSAQWRSQQLQILSPAIAQQAELTRLVITAAGTRFGRDHGFASIASVKDFQSRVPLRRYSDFWDDYWKGAYPLFRNLTWPGEVPYFALTSGTTTGATKYIPVSRDMVRSNGKGALEVLMSHFIRRPGSAVMGGKFLVLGGSTNLDEVSPGVLAGDLSGIEAVETPWWAEPYTLPPREISLLGDWEEKIDRVARLALKEDIRSITGTPSWMLVFFDKLRELKPDADFRLSSYFPNLELLVFGGMDFKPYAKRFNDLLVGSRADLREAYAASEGFLACADRGQGEGMRLIVDNGIFYEFVPVDELDSPNPTRHWLGNVETGVNYAVVLSTCSGLWAYVIGDTVRFVETDPPRILITGRTSYVLSAFGEHLIDEEVEKAVTAACDRIDARLSEYSVAAEFPEDPGVRGRHLYVVEFVDPQPSTEALALFSETLDQRLSELNADYQSLRSGDYSLRPPMVRAVPPGTFIGWMKSRGQLGGQHKVPRIIADQDLAKNLWSFCGVDEAPG